MWQEKQSKIQTCNSNKYLSDGMHKNTKELLVEENFLTKTFSCYSLVKCKKKKREKIAQTKLKKSFPHFFVMTSSWDLCGGSQQFKWKISSKCSDGYFTRVLGEEAGAARGKLLHSLAVILWGCDLIVRGTEEGWWILHQVPEEKATFFIEAESLIPGSFKNQIKKSEWVFLVPDMVLNAGCLLMGFAQWVSEERKIIILSN